MIDRIARGTDHAGDVDLGVFGLTIPGVVVGTAGSTLQVTASNTDGDSAVPEPPATVVWNGHALTRRANKQGTLVGVSIWVLENAPAETGLLVAAWGNPHWLVELIATEVTGAATSSFDVQAADNGISGTPSSGPTAPTTQAAEMVIGAVAQGLDAASGTFDAPFAEGQTVADADPDHGALATAEGFAIVSAIAAYTLSKSSAATAEWCAAVITLKAAAGDVVPDAAPLMPQSMASAKSFEIGI